MKKPNQQLFRLLRFAIRFPGWHTYSKELSKHIKRGVVLGFFDMGGASQFRLKHADWIDCDSSTVHKHTITETDI